MYLTTKCTKMAPLFCAVIGFEQTTYVLTERIQPYQLPVRVLSGGLSMNLNIGIDATLITASECTTFIACFDGSGFSRFSAEVCNCNALFEITIIVELFSNISCFSLKRNSYHHHAKIVVIYIMTQGIIRPVVRTF